MAKSPAIYILYGINEGPAMSKKFRVACKASGFTFTRTLSEADIIFAHSGGGLLIPEKVSAKLTVIVGLAYWPGQSWLSATRRHLKAETQVFREHRAYGSWALKWLYRAGYFFKFYIVHRMGRNQHLEAPWNNPSYQILVRNQYDAYLTPDIFTAAFKGPRTFLSLPGSHDDCWDNPRAYVDLLQSLYAKR